MLYGRDHEVSRLSTVLEAARQGRAETLVVTGEAGIGKSALLGEVAARADDMTVLRTCGSEAETHLTFGGLFDILAPVLELRHGLPEVQRQALEGAFALAGVPSGDPFTVRIATLGLLAAAAEERPVLVVIDDAQWLDSASLDTLSFAVRRLDADLVGTLIALRAPEPVAPPSPLAAFPSLHLAELGADAAEELLGAHTSVELSPALRTEILATARGNALALIEIPHLIAGQVDVGDHLGRPLPVGQVIRANVDHSMLAIPSDCRKALVLLAATGDHELAGDALTSVMRSSAASGFELGLTVLGPAEDAGLVTIDGSSIDFVHWLVRSAVYHSARPSLRRAAHRALAAAATGPRAAEARAWHLAAATVGPDEEVACLLETAGAHALDRCAFAAASAAFVRAARFTADAASRARRLLRAAGTAQLAGLPDAERLAEAALADASDPLVRAEVQLIRAHLWNWRGDVKSAVALLRSESERLSGVDPARSAAMLVAAVVPALHSGNLMLARDIAELAVVHPGLGDGDMGFAARIALAWVRICHGEADPSQPFGVPVKELISLAPDGPGVLPFIGLMLVWVGEHDAAAEAFDAVQLRSRELSAPALLPFVLTSSADLEFRTGRWASGFSSAAEAVRLSTDLGNGNILAAALIQLGRFEAAMGRDQDCRSHVAQALSIARAAGVSGLEAYAAQVLGLLAMTMGSYGEAIAQLETARRLTTAEGICHPGVVVWAVDLVEALARLDRRQEAREVLTLHQEWSTRTGYLPGLATAARARLLLAADADVDEVAAEGLACDDSVGLPFERARLLLVLGERRRRADRRVEARDPLRQALAIFDRLGAVAWAERASAELRAAGARSRPGSDALVSQLSPQELQVARIIARGATNREAATGLFLSTKTIESHLSSVYRKLGLRSRAELAVRFAKADLTVR